MAETLTNRVSRGREGWGTKTAKTWNKKRREGSGEGRKAVSGVKMRYQRTGQSRNFTSPSSLISYLHP